MAGERTTPVDEFGIPLRIAPRYDTIKLGEPRTSDWHHPWHPSVDPILVHTAGGQALRAALYSAPRVFHNHGKRSYHRFYRGPHVPTEPNRQFRIVVLTSAGLVTKKLLDMSSGEPEEVDASEEQWAMLRAAKGHGYRYKRAKQKAEPVRSFLIDVVLGQSLEHEPERVWEFLDRRTIPDRRRELGAYLLGEQIQLAADLVVDDYNLAMQNGQLHPRLTLEAIDAATFIQRQINRSRAEQASLISCLSDRLIAAALQTA